MTPSCSDSLAKNFQHLQNSQLKNPYVISLQLRLYVTWTRCDHYFELMALQFAICFQSQNYLCSGNEDVRKYSMRVLCFVKGFFIILFGGIQLIYNVIRSLYVKVGDEFSNSPFYLTCKIEELNQAWIDLLIGVRLVIFTQFYFCSVPDVKLAVLNL